MAAVLLIVGAAAVVVGAFIAAGPGLALMAGGVLALLAVKDLDG